MLIQLTAVGVLRSHFRGAGNQGENYVVRLNAQSTRVDSDFWTASRNRSKK